MLIKGIMCFGAGREDPGREICDVVFPAASEDAEVVLNRELYSGQPLPGHRLALLGGGSVGSRAS